MTDRTTTPTCATCGRRLPAGRRSRRSPESAVRRCGERCRRNRPGRVDRRLEQAILELLSSRPRGATVCPSEAARRVAPDNWRGLMQRTRNAARRLVAAGDVEIVQRGRPVDPSTARGPIRIRRRQATV